MASFLRGKITRCLALGALYAGLATPLFVVWEIVQLPLYTIWTEQSIGGNLFSALHCTVGDAVIAFSAMTMALLFAWLIAPRHTPAVIVILTLALGIGITITSEIISMGLLKRWAYAPAMPIVPLLGIGLSPLLQWLIVPAVVLTVLRRRIVSSLLTINASN